MPTVYGANASPFVRKVRVVLTEKNIPYELEPVFPGPMAPPEFRTLSPLNKIPAFRDGDRTLADSSVICAYLERTHPTPALYPSDPYEYARALVRGVGRRRAHPGLRRQDLLPAGRRPAVLRPRGGSRGGAEDNRRGAA